MIIITLPGRVVNHHYQAPHENIELSNAKSVSQITH